MRSVIAMLFIAALTLPSSWLFAQADAQMLCTQYAEDSGLAEDEIADYVADCVTNLGGENSVAAPMDETESGTEGDSGAEVDASESVEEYAEERESSESPAEFDSDDELSDSADEYDSDDELSDSADEYDAGGETSESADEYAEDEATTEALEAYDSDETTTDQAMDTVGEGNADGNVSEPGVDEAKTGLTSPFGEIR